MFSSKDSESQALKASGAHDLGCPVAELTLPAMSDQHGKRKLVVEGCGKRAVYFWDVQLPAPYTQEHHAVLEGLVPLSPTPP